MFTLRGVSNTGKTTKIKQIAQWVIDNYSVTKPHQIDTKQGEILGILEVNKLRLGFVSAGDDLVHVKKVEQLLNNKDGDAVDIIINACRTRGAGRRYLENNFNKRNGWLIVNIYIKQLDALDIAEQSSRDVEVLDELKSWLTGL